MPRKVLVAMLRKGDWVIDPNGTEVSVWKTESHTIQVHGGECDATVVSGVQLTEDGESFQPYSRVAAPGEKWLKNN